MTKEPNGKACKICERAFLVFRWKPGGDARYKKTEICRTCARLKNVCQTCILDLQFGLPVEVRDKMLPSTEVISLPTQAKNRNLAIERIETQLSEQNESGDGSLAAGYERAATKSTALQRLARKTPFYERNKAHYCSFFARGECNRGSFCPFRHELAPTGDLSQQNIRDRYAGMNDPVARKMMNNTKKSASQKTSIKPSPPDDQSITTIWVGNVPDSTTENDLREIFETVGQIQRISFLKDKCCAFLTYRLRTSAEEAINQFFDSSSLHGETLRLNWSKSKDPSQPQSTSSSQPMTFPTK
jgi:pre-mRNA-splicing factor RBM22/SLT11